LDDTPFVVNSASALSTVGEHDATTGGAINAGFITKLNATIGIAAKDAN
jgi:hypothetical protein